MNSFKLTMKPKWDEIENVRNKSSNFLAKQGLSNDSVQAFTMVIKKARDALWMEMELAKRIQTPLLPNKQRLGALI